MAKKVNVALAQKELVLETVKLYFAESGVEVSEGADFGLTGAIVLHFAGTDVQLKAITPKAGLKGRYARVED